jgi:hypothetical protein
MKSKPPPLFSISLAIVRTNSRDSHYALSEEEEVGIVSSSLYTSTVAMGIVTSPCSLLLQSTVAMSVDDVSTLVATNK